jgi:hypothetical protein
MKICLINFDANVGAFNKTEVENAFILLSLSFTNDISTRKE